MTLAYARLLQHLDAAIEETLRVYLQAGETPPRVSPADVVEGYYVPKGLRLAGPYAYAPFHETSTTLFLAISLTFNRLWLHLSVGNLPQSQQLSRSRLLLPRALAASVSPALRAPVRTVLARILRTRRCSSLSLGPYSILALC